MGSQLPSFISFVLFFFFFYLGLAIVVKINPSKWIECRMISHFFCFKLRENRLFSKFVSLPKGEGSRLSLFNKEILTRMWFKIVQCSCTIAPCSKLSFPSITNKKKKSWVDELELFFWKIMKTMPLILNWKVSSSYKTMLFQISLVFTVFPSDSTFSNKRRKNEKKKEWKRIIIIKCDELFNTSSFTSKIKNRFMRLCRSSCISSFSCKFWYNKIIWICGINEKQAFLWRVSISKATINDQENNFIIFFTLSIFKKYYIIPRISCLLKEEGEGEGEEWKQTEKNEQLARI